ncbi:MAG: plsY [Rhodospirillales bacterium]|nr:plsY [Rhodospirillales bacterium]
MTLALAVIAGYLLGSIPFGLVLTRIAGYGDLRTIGSGNIGATNVLRTGNKPLAAATLILDAGKGAIAVLLARTLAPDEPSIAIAAAAGALAGHLYPVWLRFRGGKGVATTLGTMLALEWRIGVAACVAWLVTALLFRISSLAALVAMLILPLAAWGLGDRALTWFAIAVAAVVWGKHAANLQRLAAGTEPKIGGKRA